ncbi:MAG TPA: hypothetical protein VLF60_00290 [Candidatus Saccharimonadales bacterium]|nr:hypothetical protein [Candidatus Saccharimonadales bacterium]
MARLPRPGSDVGNWGAILNEFLLEEHNDDGTLKCKDAMTAAAQTATDAATAVAAKYSKPSTGIPKSDLGQSVQTSLGSADSAVQTVNGKAGANVTVTASDLGAPTFTQRLTIDESGAGTSTLLLPSTTGSTGMTIGGDTNLFRSGSGQLQTSSAFFVVRATLGIAALGVTVSGDTTRRFQINTDGKLLWSAGSGAQDTTVVRETGGGLKIGSSAGTTASPATPTLTLAPTGVTSGSPSTGGTLFINQGTNPGSAFNTFTNAGSGALGRLMNVAVLNSAFDQAGLHVDYAGTVNGFEVVSTSTSSTSNAVSVTSTNPNSTAMGVNGSESSKGTVKIVHTYPGSSDANASALSLRANGAGTAAQGIFFDAEDGGTTGNLMKMRNAGIDKFIMGPNGSLYSANNIQVGSTTSDVGGGSGVLGLKQAITVPTTNPAAGGVIVYADQGSLKWRDPSGNVHDLGNGTVSASLSPDATPGEQSYLGWNYDPIAAANSTQPTSGTPVLIKVKAAQSGTVTAINLNVNTLGAGFTANASYAALYDMNGNRLGLTADIAASLASTGAKALALTAGVAVTAGTFYYVYFVSTATTMPALNRAGNLGAINQNTNPGTYRFATLGSGVSSPPASLTLASSAALSTSYWAALS